jgi:hypothetical protein
MVELSRLQCIVTPAGEGASTTTLDMLLFLLLPFYTNCKLHHHLHEKIDPPKVSTSFLFILFTVIYVAHATTTGLAIAGSASKGCYNFIFFYWWLLW